VIADAHFRGCLASIRMARLAKKICRIVWVFSIIVLFAVTIGSVVLGALLRMQLVKLQGNMENDPEKRFIDECMRDFESLSTDDPTYRSEFSRCIKELTNDESLKRLPHIRLTVDERVCDPVDLCSGGDPGQCEDVGTPREANYKAGDVMQCYQLIIRAKAEQDAYKKAQLLDDIASQCTSSERWKNHANTVSLLYCFWKHLQFGVCSNNMRTNCPSDSSCCPISQSDPLNALAYRPDQYLCRKSPIVGLYCMQRDYRVPVNISIEPRGELCTTETCPSFAWCRDFADVPGLCLGEACKDYTRAANFLIVCIVCAALGLVFDIAVIVLLLRWPVQIKLKSTANALSACLKVLAFALCSAGGAKDFTRELVAKSCYNAEGNVLALSAKDGVDLFEMVTLLTIAGSLALAPMAMQWGGPLTALPYARV